MKFEIVWLQALGKLNAKLLSDRKRKDQKAREKRSLMKRINEEGKALPSNPGKKADADEYGGGISGDMWAPPIQKNQPSQYQTTENGKRSS